MIQLQAIPTKNGRPKEDGLEYCHKPGYEYIDGTHVLRAMPTGTGPCLRVKMYPFPVAQFSSDTQECCQNNEIHFNDESQFATLWVWDFGDEAISNDQNPTHVYAAPGIYDVALTVQNDAGEDIKEKQAYITIHQAPISSFSASPLSGAEPLTVAFSDTSTGEIDSWAWDFGDGATSNDQNPTHTYVDAGIYTVSLTVSNSFCPENTHTATDYISVSEAVTCPWEDDFTGANNTQYDSAKWSQESWEQVPCIWENALHMGKHTGQTGFGWWSSLKNNGNFTSNYNIQVDVVVVEAANSDYTNIGFTCADPATGEEIYLWLHMEYNTSTNKQEYSLLVQTPSGALADIDLPTFAEGDTIQLKIDRNSGTYTFYYAVNSGWQQVTQYNDNINNFSEIHLYADLYAYIDDNDFRFDNFIVNSGCPGV